MASALFSFDPQAYGPAVAALVEPPRLAELGPGSANASAWPLLKRLTASSVCAPHSEAEPEHAQACLAGLWLYHDYLDESHAISQDLSGATGSFWHGIMHRREPDAGNAKYWFRRVGEHAAFPRLLAAARQFAAPADTQLATLVNASAWDPLLFVDLCDTARRSASPVAAVCSQIQLAEWQLLFDYCWNRATGVV